MLFLAVDRFGAALADLPWLIHIPVAMAFLAGLVLWLVGRKVIRPVTITTGLAIGGMLGFLLVPVVVPTIGVSPYLGLVGGSVVGLLLALMLYRVATAVTFGSAVGAGCGMMAAALLGATLTLPAAVAMDEPDTGIGGGEQPVFVPRKMPVPVKVQPVDQELPDDMVKPGVRVTVTKPKVKPPVKAQPVYQELPDDMIAPGVRVGETPKPVVQRPPVPKPVRHVETVREPVVQPESESAASRVGTFWWVARDEWAEWWTFVPGASKRWIVGATVVGLGVGTLIGLLLPAWAAGASTAAVGSAMWLPSGMWLGKALHVPWISTLSLGVGGWIVVWVVIALIGVGAQWYGLFPSTKAAAAAQAGGKRPGTGRKKTSAK